MIRRFALIALLLGSLILGTAPLSAQDCTTESAQAAFDAGQYADAFDFFQCAYDANPDDPEAALLGIGRAALMLNQFSISGNTAELAADAAGASNSEYGAQQIDQLSTTLAKDPDNVALMTQLAHWLWLRARDDEALPLYDAILASDPLNVFALTFRASSQAYLGQVKEADAGFEQAFALAPENDHVYAIAATTYLDNGDSERAISYADRAIALQPDDFAGRYVTRGDAYTDLGNNEAALADYTRALELNPGMYNALIGLGDASYNLGDYADAVDQYEQALTADPESRYAQAGLAAGLSALNDAGTGQALADLFQTADSPVEIPANGKPQTLPLDFGTVYFAQLEANAGDTIRASVESVEAGSLDPALIVLDSTGQVVAFADNTSDYDAVLEGFVVPEAGAFTVVFGLLDTRRGDAEIAVSVTPAG